MQDEATTYFGALSRAVAAQLERGSVDAERVCAGLLNQNPREPNVNLLMGLVRAEQGRVREALQHLNVADASRSSVPTDAVRALAHERPADVGVAVAAMLSLLKEVVGMDRSLSQGAAHDAVAAARALMQSSDVIAARTGAVFVATHALFPAFSVARTTLQRLVRERGADAGLHSALAYTCWFAGDNMAAAEHGLLALRHGLDDYETFRLLGMYQMTAQRPDLAFISFMGATAFAIRAGQDPLASWRTLAHRVMRGDREAAVSFLGTDLRFRLSAMNSMALEADVHHAAGRLTEEEELRYCASFLPRGGVMVEVGVLVGNHAAYFAKALCPRKIIAFDANAACLEETRLNLGISGVGTEVELDFRHAAVGDRECEVEFGAVGPVTQVTLDGAVRERAGFYKIDVDGAEISVLTGMRRILREDRPLVMIEVDQGNVASFLDVLNEVGYREVHRVGHGSYSNYFIQPA